MRSFIYPLPQLLLRIVKDRLGSASLFALFLSIFMLSASDSFGTATRYQVTAPNAPVGATTFCSGATVGSYTNQPGSTSCTITGSSATNTITWQWVYDGSVNISGASGTFVVGSSTPGAVTLTSAQAAVLSTLSVGAHTLQCKYTPNTTDCSGTAGVAIFSPALTVYVLGPPGSITGTATTCAGSQTTLSNSVPGGTWSTVSGTGSATVSSAGVVTGSTVGTATISYTTGCGTPVARVVTVTAAIGSITGATAGCVGTTTTLSNSTGGGTWTSSNTAVATINSSGVVNPVAGGTTTFSYTASGCTATSSFSVSNTVPPVAVSASPTNFCAGGTSNLTASSTVSNYTVNTTPFAPVSFTPTGTFNSSSSVSSGSLDDGYFSVSMPFAFSFYGTNITAGSTCYISTNGLISFGTGITTTYIGTLPTTSYPYSTISVFGRDLNLNSGGNITYGTTGTTPNRKFIVSYNSVPDYSTLVLETGQIVIYESNGKIELQITTAQASTHTMGVQNSGGTIAAVVPGHNNTATAASNSAWRFEWPKAQSYTWTPSTFLSATTGATISAGTVTTTTTYTVGATYEGCTANASVTVTVNTSPAGITGTAAMCVGATSTLANTVGAGTWTSGNTSVATVGASTGIVTGIAAGTAICTYTITSSGCYTTKIVTINQAPANIAGTPNVCAGATTSLTNTVSGGTWVSTNTSAATINSSGVVSGVASGVSMITYTLTSTGCYKTQEVTVNPLPTINVTPASTSVCAGGSTSLTASSPALQFTLLTQNFNSGTGSWVISTPTDPGDGISPWKLTSSSIIPITGDGTAMLEAAPSASSSGGYMISHVTSPSFSTMGFGSVVLTFNEHLYSNALADVNVKVQYSINGGSSWNTLISQIPVTGTDSLVGDGTWDASEPEVTISLPSDALNVANVKLRWLYETNWGGWWEIDNIAVKAALPAATFTWAGIGGATGLSCTNCPTPTITPAAMGANTYSVTAASTCSASTIVTVNVNPLPGAISGATATLCVGSTIALSNPDGSGTWSSNDPLVAAVDPSTGVVSGVAAGSAVISYTLPTTCSRTVTVNVNAAPAAITGTQHVCEGSTTTLSHEVTGGVWSSGSSLVSVAATSGAITGDGIGNAVVTYVLPSGCRTSATVTVNELPSTITGLAVVCENATITLECSPAGGTWTSGDDLIATIATGTNEIHGVLAGNAPVTYTLPTGCSNSKIVTVNAAPEDITGTRAVCEGLTTSLSSATPGGAWSESDPDHAMVDADGLVNGVLGGTSVISYTLTTGCYKSVTVTVNELPSAITGTKMVCEDATTVLTSTPAGGTWTSGDNSIASITVTEEVLGVLEGTVPVTYTLSTGCLRTTVVTVNAAPGNISGTLTVCEGSTTTLTNSVAGGVWSSSSASIADFTSAGVLEGYETGDATVTYTLPAGCYKTALATVNETPTAFTGVKTVCEGLTTLLSSSPAGGSWSTSNSSVAEVGDASGLVSGQAHGTATISYTMSTGCMRVDEVTVNALPENISGPATVCVGSAITLENTSGPGAWTSGDAAIADVNASGEVDGIAEGNTHITYTLSASGCYRSKSISVNPLPAAITGTMQVCEGLTTSLEDATAGGSWSTGATSIATVNSSGVVNGISHGSEVVTYELVTGCKTTATVVVNPLPGNFTGSLEVCAGLTTALGNETAGGTWSGGDAAVATIDASGLVTAIAAGTTNVVYTLTSTSCQKTATIQVNPLPEDITGTFVVCEGATTALTNTTPGGTWSSLSSDASVNTAGLVTGNSAGSAAIIYTLSTGCFKTATVSINPIPDVIMGSREVCVDATTSLTNASGGGSWSTSASATASINSAGVVTGIAAGNAPVTYAFTTGCSRIIQVTVNALPNDITGSGRVCEGSTISLSNTTGGGTWISGNTLVAGVNASGVVNGVDMGNADIAYMLSTGCLKSVNIVVDPLPEVITGATEVCEGLTISLANASGTGTWSTDDAAIADVDAGTGVVNGAGSGTVNISYTLSTGCARATAVTVKALPDMISGADHVCEGLTTILTNSTSGGSWSSDDMINVPVDASGVVTGIAPAVTNIVYTGPNGCSRSVSMEVYLTPAGISGATAVCEGSTTGLLDITPDGTWSTSDNTIADVDVLTGVVNGVSAGATTITYALSTGCMQTSPITVHQLPTAITGTPQVCEGATTAMASTPIGGTWSAATSSNISIDAAGVVSGISAGAADITYTLATGCSQRAALMVNPVPSIYSLTGGGPYCVGTGGVPVGVALSESGIDYQLFQGGAPVGGLVAGTGAAIGFGMQMVADIYSVQAINNTTGCTSDMSGTTTVSITPLNIPSVTVAPGSGTTVCAGTLTTFTASPVNGGSLPVYTWEVNGAPVPAVTSSTYSYTPLNGDIVRVTVLSNEVCAIPATASDMIVMTVNANQTPVATIALPAGVTSVCRGSNITLTASSVFGGSAPAYVWLRNGGSTGVTGTSFTFAPNNGDVIKCELTSNYTCVTAPVVTSNVLTMVVDPVFVPIVNIAVSPGTSIASGTPVTFTAVIASSSAGPSPLYQWFKNGIAITGATNSVYNPASVNNNDSISCRVTGSAPCGYESFNSVRMFVKSTGVETVGGAFENVTLLPNPNKGDFVIRGELSQLPGEEVTLQVTNMIGQTVYTGKASTKPGGINERIQLSRELANGMYMLNIRANGEMKVIHFVLEQ